MAQVHGAVLPSGEKVVVKILRPGIVKLVKDDLGVLYTMAGLFEKYVPESRPFNPITIVDEFFRTLELETNFLVEANNIRRMALNFSLDDTIKIPKVYEDFCSPRVLVMERLEGIPLSQLGQQKSSPSSPGLSLEDRKLVVDRGIRAFFTMVFKHGLFHGDLHAGNLFILPENKIGLVDFGVVGRLSPKTKNSITAMLVALAIEDYESLAYQYLELAPYNGGISLDQFTKDIRDLFSPYYGMTFKNVNLGKLLLDSTAIAARHSIIMPSELMLFFKAIVTVEGMGRLILEDFDILPHMIAFSEDVASAQFDPQKWLANLAQFGKDSSELIQGLPRNLKQLLRKLNSRDFALDIHISEFRELRNSIENSGFVVARGLLAAALILAGALALQFEKGPVFYGLPLVSLICFFIAFWVSIFLLQRRR